jgi:hypothetical protein
MNENTNERDDVELTTEEETTVVAMELVTETKGAYQGVFHEGGFFFYDW